MKRISTILVIILSTVLGFSQGVEVRLTNPSESGVFRVQFRVTNPAILPTTIDELTDLGFRIWWNDPSVLDIDVVQAETYGGVLNESNPIDGNENGSGPITGKVVGIGFCSGCSSFFFPEDWVLNEWVTVATVKICINNNCSPDGAPPGITAEDFLIQQPFQLFPNFGINFNDFTPEIGALPLNLLSFEATKSGEKNASLSWVTTNEENTSHFSIERSYDKKSWSSIGSVAAAGYSIGVEHYSFQDVGVYDGVKSQFRAYYRLNMVDRDGRSKLSPVRNVDFGTGSSSKREVAVYPNPASEGIHIEWDINNLDQPTALEFYDINGKLIYTKEVAENSNKEYIDFSKTTLQPGLYMLRVLSGNTPIDHKQVIVGR